MNKIYKVVWNASAGLWIAVSEFAKGVTKSSTARKKALGEAVLLGGLVTFSPGLLAAAGNGGGTAGGSNATAISDCAGSNAANASGGNSLALLCGATASGSQSIAVGYNASATEYRGVVLGAGASSNGSSTVVIGDGATGNQTRAVVIGFSSVSSGAFAVALGNQSSSAESAVAIGSGAGATSIRGVAIGNNAKSSATAGIAIGGFTSVASSSDNGIALGLNAGVNASSSNAIAQGTNASVSSAGGIAIGNSSNVSASSTNGIAIGNTASASNTNAIAFGVNSTASAGEAIAQGLAASASSAAAIAIGSNSSAASAYSVALGSAAAVDANSGQSISLANGSAITYAQNAVALGYAAKINGTSSNSSGGAIALGNSATVNAGSTRAVALGAASTAGGVSAIAFGDTSTSSSANAIAIGATSSVDGNSAQSIAQGSGSAVTYAQNAIALGNTAKVNGTSANASTNSIALGNGAAVAAGATNAIAQGTNASASAISTVAVGAAAKATASNANAIGSGSSAASANAIAFGNTTSVDANSAQGIAQGNGSTVTYAQNALAIGSSAKVNGASGSISTSSIAIGNGATVAAGSADAIAQGTSATASNRASIAIGQLTSSSGEAAVAIGGTSKATGGSAVALGVAASSAASNAIGIGSSASVDANSTASSALGQNSAITYAPNAIAFGTSAKVAGSSSASSDNSIAIGNAANIAAGATNAIAQGTSATASAVNAIATGNTATASGANSIALGTTSTASGGRAIALGSASTSSGSSAIAIGDSSASRASNTVAVGNAASVDANSAQGIAQGYSSAITYAQNGLAIGNAAKINGTSSNLSTSSMALGNGATVAAGATNAIAQGTGATVAAGATNAMAQGTSATVSSANAIAFGNTASVDANSAQGIAQGYSSAITYAQNGLAIGNAAKINGTSSSTSASAIALGNGATVAAGANNAIAQGTSSTASGVTSIAIGYSATASATNALSIGNVASATSNNTVAIGNSAKASGARSTVVGGDSSATGDDSLVTGNSSTASGTGSIAVGKYVTSSGTNSIAQGTSSAANAASAIAFGSAASVDANSAQAIAQGSNSAVTYSQGGIAIGNAAKINGASSNISTSSIAIGSGATVAAGASNAIAQGTGAAANAANTVASGNAATAGGSNAVALGNATSAGGSNSVALGNASSASGTRATAIGSAASSASTSAIAFGNAASVDANSTQAIAQGSGSAVTYAQNALAIGSSAKINGSSSSLSTSSMALGNGATVAAGATNAVAQGTSAAANAASAIALGNATTASGSKSIAMGDSSQAQTAESVAIGSAAIAKGGKSVSIGAGNTANGDGAVAIGDPNSATGDGAVASGKDNTSNGAGAIAIGNTNNAQGQGSVALGYQSKSDVAGGIALGDTAHSVASKGVALGSGATANNANDVALGANSTTAAAVGTSSTTIRGTTYNFAGTSPSSVVSVGSSGSERQVTNVAAGRISSTSTDAINGSQLYATNSAIESISTTANQGWNLQTNGDTATNIAPGGTVQLNNGQNIKITRSGSAVTIATADALTATSLTTGNTVVNTSGVTISNGANGTVTLSNTGLSNGNNKVTNVAAGTLSSTSTDAVNGSQLYTVQQQASQPITFAGNTGSSARQLGSTLTISGGASTAGTYSSANLKTVVDSSTGTVTLQMADAPKFGNVTINDGGKITGLTAGTADTDAVNVSQLNSVSTVANKGWNLQTNGDTASNVAPGGTVQLNNGQNIKITRSGSTVTVATADDLTATSLTTGNTVVNTSGVTISNGANGTVTLSNTGLSNGNNKVTNVAAGTLSSTSTDAVNGSQLYTVQQQASQPITFAGNTGSSARQLGSTLTISGGASTAGTYSSANLKTVVDSSTGTVTLQMADAPKFGNVTINDGGKITGVTAGTADTDAVNVGQLNDVSTVANKGWNLQANGDTATNVAPGDTVALNDGQNIKVTRNGEAVTIATADDLVASSLTAGNTLVNNTGVTLSNGANGTVSLTNGGLNNGGNTITNVAAGTADTDAVNVAQLNSSNSDLTSKGLDFTADSGATTHRDLGEALAVKGGATGTLTDNNIGVVSNGTDTLTVKLAKDVNLGSDGSLTAGNTLVNNTGVTLSNGANGTVSLTNGGLNNGGNTITNVAAGTNDTDAANIGQLNEVSAVANKGWNLQANGDTATNVAPGDTVQLNDGQNIKVTRSGEAVTIATADDLVASSLTAGNTLVNNAGVTLSGGSNGTVSLTNGGLNNGGNTITNVAAGTADTDAVNVAQLNSSNSDLTSKGLNFTADSGATTHRDLGEALAVKGGATGTLTDNNIGVVSNGTDTLTVKLAKDVNLGSDGSLTAGNTLVNNTGVTLSNGANGTVSLTNGGLNNGGNTITNVAAGTLSSTSTDAVNGSQLYTVQQQASQPITFAGNTGSSERQLGSTLTISGGASTAGTYSSANLQTVVDSSTGTVTLQMADAPKFGNVTINDGGKITGVTAGTADTDAVNVAQLNSSNSDLTSKGLDFTADSGATTHRDLGEALAVKGGATGTLTDNNIGVVSNGTDTLTVKLAKDVNLGSDGSLTAGNTVVNNGGVTISNGSNGTVSLTNGGLNNGGNTITNVAAGTNDTDAANIGQLNEVSTVANKGWNLQANGDTATNVAPGDTVQLNDGQNIKVTRNGEAVTIATANDLVADSLTAGNTLVNNAGVTLSGGNNGTVSLTNGGLNNGGNTITNVAAGTLSSTSTDAVNGSQLYTVQQQASQPITFAGNTGSSERQLGSTLTISGGASTAGTYSSANLQTVVDSSTGTVTLQMADAPKFGNVTINDGGKITGVTAGTADTDAVNVAQLNSTNSDLTSKGLDFTADSGATTHRDLGEALAVKGGATGTLTDNNIGVVSNGSDTLTVKLAKDVDLGSDGSLTAGNTVVDNGGVTISNGSNGTVSLTNGGLNNGGNTITNVAAGTNDTDAANVGQVNEVSAIANKGWNLQANGDTATNVAPGDTVQLNDGQNIKITRSGEAVTIATADDLVASSLTTGNTVMNNGGVTLSGGSNGTVSLTNSGLNNGGNTITNVAAGTLSSTSTDAVNGSQLYTVQQQASQPITFAGNTGSSERQLGSTLTISGGASTAGTYSSANLQTVVDSSTGTVTLQMADAPKFGNVTINDGGKITGVTAGTADTDAVNVSQLTTTNSDLTSKGLNFTADSGATTHRDLGEALAVKGGATGTLTDNNIGVVSNGTDTLTVKLAKDVDLGSDGSLTAGNTVVNNAGVTLSGGSNGTVSLTNGGLNNGGNTITNVAAGTLSSTSTDAVNGSQLYTVQQQASQPITFAGNTGSSERQLGSTVTISGGASTAGTYSSANLQTVVDSSTGTVTLQMADAPKFGNVTINDGGKITGVTAGTADTDAVNVAQLNSSNSDLTSKGLDFTADSGATTHRDLGEALAVKGGATGTLTDNNIGVVSNGTDTLTVKLAKDVDLGSDGSLTAGNTVVNNGGVTISNGSNGTVSLTNGGLNNGGNTITNVAAGTNATDAANVGQVNEVSAIANKGWNLQANGDTATNVAPGDTVQLNDGQNIKVTRSGEAVTIATADDLVASSLTTGNTVMNNGGVTISNGSNGTVSLTNSGLNNGGNTLSNVAAGTADTDAVNVAQLNSAGSDLTSKGLNFTADSGGTAHRDLGEALAIKGGATASLTDGNIGVVSNGSDTLSVKLAKDVNLGSIGSLTAGNTLVNNAGVTISSNVNGTVSLSGTGLDNGGNKIVGVAAGTNATDAVNVSQLNSVSSVANKGWNLQANGDTATNVAPGDTVQLNDGQNIKVTRNGEAVTIATADDLVADSLTAGNTLVNNAGVTLSGGSNGTVSLTNGGLNNGGNTITNVAAGTLSSTSTDAVNGSQLYTVQQQASQPLTFAGNTGSSERQLGSTVTISGGASTAGTYSSANLQTVVDSSTGTVTLQMADAPKFGNVTINDGGKITGVAAGTADTDAANVGQLASAGNDLTSKGLNFTADSGATAHRDLGQALAVKGGATGTLSDNNIGVVSNGTDTLSVKLAKDVNLGSDGSLTAGNTVVNNGGVTISNGSNGTVSLTNNGLDNGGNKITNVAAGTNATDAANVGQVNEIGAVANKGWNLQANGDTATNVAPGDTVQLNDGQNIKVTRNGEAVTIATADDLVASSLTAGNTLVNNAGVTLSGGSNGTVSLTNGGLNNGGNTITNVAAGTLSSTSTDAVNGSQLYTVQQQASQPLTFAGNSGSVTRQLGSTVTISGEGSTAGTYSAGNLRTVVDANTGTVQLQMADAPKFGNVTINDGGKITGVAAGTADTDAANVGQLASAGNDLTSKGLNFTADSGATAHRDLGQALAVKGGATGTLSDGNIGVVSNGTDTLSVKLAKDVDLGSDGSLTAGNTVVNNGGITISNGSNGTVSLGNGGLDNGGNKITNVAAGTNATDAANVGQVNEIGAVANKGWNLQANGDTATNVAPGDTVALNNGQNIKVTRSGEAVTIATADDLVASSLTAGNTVVNSGGITISNGANGTVSLSSSGLDNGGNKLTNVAAGTNTTDAVNVGQLASAGSDLTSKGLDFTGDSGTTAHRDLGQALAVKGGATGTLSDGNIGVVSNGSDTLSVKLAKDVDLGSDGSLTAGNTVVNNGGITISNGSNGTVSLGNGGLNNGGNKITNVAAGTNATDAANVGQVNEIGAVANKGWNLQANGDTATNVAPGGTVQLNDGKNIKVTRSGSAVTIATADDLLADSLTAGNTLVNNGGITISNGANGTVSLSGSGLDNGGNRIVNVAAGTVSSTSTDAINGSQLYTVQQQASQPLTFAGNSGSVTRQLGSTITISGEGSTAGSYSAGNLKTVVDANTGTIQLQMADAPKFGNVTINDGGKITGLTAGTADTDAVNVSQLNAVNSTASKGWNITASGQNGSTVAPGASVDMKSSDGNLLISKTTNSNDISFALAKNITVDSVKTGNTVVSNSGVSIGNSVNLGSSGLVIANGPSVTVNGIDAGGTRITNVAAGTDSSDAVNVSQLNSAITGAKTHYYGANDGGTTGGNYNGDGATGTYAVASGVGTSASGSGSVAMGSLSNTSASGATAIGYRATASAEGSVALGSNSSDNGRGSESYIGKYSSVNNNTSGTVSVGNSAEGTTRTISNVADAKEATDAVNLRQLDGAVAAANSYTDTQISSVNKQGAENATNISNLSNGKDGFFQVNNSDSSSKPSVTGTNAAAGGAGSRASGTNSLAIGTNAVATAEDSVAIGSGSTASRSNTVSVGSSGKERQVTNVAAGTQGTDAVNVNQLKSSEQGSVRYASNSDGSTNYNQVTLGDGQTPTTVSNVAPGVAGTDATNVNQLKQGLAFAKNYTDQAVNGVRRDAFGGVAAAIATANLPQSYLPGGSMTSVGLGTYQGQSAIAVGVSTVSDNGRWVFKLSGTSSTRGDTGMGAGVGVQW